VNHPETIENTFGEELYSIPPKTVVAIATPWHTLTDADKLLLEKILSAVKLTLNHVQVIHANQLDVLHWVNRPKQVLAFGLALPGIAPYEPFELQGIQVILAPGLSQLDPDKEGKQKLWGGLKKMFA
jgi:DNA polymerase III psi subunit